jgi:selenocysteine-specific elongation factor
LDIIIGTAGHIDHGKTSLVQALTGEDADRLPEEKRRGITIDIGFAELKIGDSRFGFVDVPGHERFIKNMLAGVHGIDLVALVIAADEGVMPQTREHFDICRLLNVRAGMVVITKTDLVEAELLELVQEEARELVAGSFLDGAPIQLVSARTGAGLEELRTTLNESATRLPERGHDTVTRLPIDRSFTMRGFGAVVTGTLVTGELTEGDEMELLPTAQKVRIRGLQVHGEKVTRAVAGQRTAVNLGGIESAKIERGMTLAPAGRLRPTQIIDVEIDVLPGAARPLRTRQRVRLHLGAAEVLARVRVLEPTNEIAPGGNGFAQLRLESPVVAIAGERFILRSYSPSHTIAGGQILDALAPKHRGQALAATRDRLERLRTGDHAERLVEFVKLADRSGLTKADLAARTGWADEFLHSSTRDAVNAGSVVEIGGTLLSHSVLAGLTQATLATVNLHHRKAPLELGISRETLREKLFAHTAPEVYRSVLTQLTAEGALVLENQLVRASEHRILLSDSDQLVRDQLAKIYQDAGLEPPSFEEVVAAIKPPVQRVHARRILQLLLDAGEIFQITGELFCAKTALDQLAEKIAEFGRLHEPDRLIDVTAFKELTGVSRKWAIPLLEYLDRAKITRRAGDKRIILKTTT